MPAFGELDVNNARQHVDKPPDNKHSRPEFPVIPQFRLVEQVARCIRGVSVSPLADSAVSPRYTASSQVHNLYSLKGICIMKKMLRFECRRGRTEVVEVPADFLGPLYGAHGRKVGEIVSQMEASDLPELGTVSAACPLSVRCAR